MSKAWRSKSQTGSKEPQHIIMNWNLYPECPYTGRIWVQVCPYVNMCIHIYAYISQIYATIYIYPYKHMYIFVDFQFKVTQSCLTLCNPMDYTVHGILQVRILEWVAFPFSGWSSQPRDQAQVSRICGIQRYIHTYTHICRQTKAMMKNHFSKTNTVLFHLYADLKKKDKTNKNACRYREEIGGCQRWGGRR